MTQHCLINMPRSTELDQTHKVKRSDIYMFFAKPRLLATGPQCEQQLHGPRWGGSLRSAPSGVATDFEPLVRLSNTEISR